MATFARSVGVAISEIRYAIAFAGMNERLWSHFDTTLNCLQILLGMLALAGVLADATLIRVAGGALAILSALQIGLGPRRRSIEFRDARVRFHELVGRAPSLDLLHLDVELEKLKGGSPFGLMVLSRPAYNVVAESLGSTDLYLLSPMEALFVRLAW